MHYNFLFNGSGFTVGVDLTEHDTHRFSHLVANHFGNTYQNISGPGKCNDTIAETTINWFEEGNTCDLAIVQMSGQSRFTWYDENKNSRVLETKLLEVFSDPRVEEGAMERFRNEMVQSKTLDAAEKYFSSIHSDYLACQNYYKNVFTIKNYLNLKNIPFLFLSTVASPESNAGWSTLCTDVVLKPITTKVGASDADNAASIIANREVNPQYFCEDLVSAAGVRNDSNFWQLGKNPNEAGHQMIANYIISEIE